MGGFELSTQKKQNEKKISKLLNHLSFFEWKQEKLMEKYNKIEKAKGKINKEAKALAKKAGWDVSCF